MNEKAIAALENLTTAIVVGDTVVAVCILWGLILVSEAIRSTKGR